MLRMNNVLGREQMRRVMAAKIAEMAGKESQEMLRLGRNTQSSVDRQRN